MISHNSRKTRFLASVMLLAMIGYAVSAIGLGLDINVFVTVGLYLAYIVVAAGLVTWLTGRLFRQHEMRKLKFDIGAIIILTTLIAMPLGFGSAFQQLANNVGKSISQDDLDGPMRVVIACMLYFSLVPILFATEALLVWALVWRKGR